VVCDADFGAADVLNLAIAHPVLQAQRTVDDLLNRRGAPLAVYGQTSPGHCHVLCDLKLMTRWIFATVIQSQLEQYLPTDIVDVVAEHRRSTAWPCGSYWKTAGMTPSALDVAAGVTVALKALSAEDVSSATALVEQLMGAASGYGSYRAPIRRSAGLTPSVRLIHDAAYTSDRSDRRVLSRLAQAKSMSRVVSTASTVTAR
jgi:hypothetical protein